MPSDHAQLLAMEALISQLSGKRAPDRDTTEAVLKVLEPDNSSLRKKAAEHAERIYRAFDYAV